MAHQQQPISLWIGVVFAFYAFVVSGIVQAGLGVLLPSILTTYHLTSTTIAWLFISQMGGYVLAVFASSVMSSRLELAQILLIANSMLSTALCICALSPSWLLLVVAILFQGLSIGLIDIAINTFIVQNPKTSHLVGCLHGFYGVGAFLSPVCITTLFTWRISWQQIYLFKAGIVGLLIIGVIGGIVFRYQPLAIKSRVSSNVPLKTLGCSSKIFTVVITGLLLFIYVGIESSVGNWAFMIQVVARQSSELVAGYSVSAYWLGITLGRFGFSYFLQWIGANRTITLSLILLLIGLLLWWKSPIFWLSLPLVGLALSAIFPATLWLLPKRLPINLVPLAVGVVTSTSSIGAALISAGAGWLASRAGLNIIPGLLLILAFIMLGLHCWLMKVSELDKRYKT